MKILAPLPVSDIQFLNVTETSFTVMWTADQGHFTGFIIVLIDKENNVLSNETVELTIADVKKKTYTGLKPGSSFTVHITAVSETTRSNTSNAQTAIGK